MSLQVTNVISAKFDVRHLTLVIPEAEPLNSVTSSSAQTSFNIVPSTLPVHDRGHERSLRIAAGHIDRERETGRWKFTVRCVGVHDRRHERGLRTAAGHIARRR